jgi:hypothetical protein
MDKKNRNRLDIDKVLKPSNSHFEELWGDHGESPLQIR